MAIQFDCPFCTSTLKVPDATAGKQGDCPRCGTKLVIPNPFAAGAAPPAADSAPADSTPQPQDAPTPPPASQAPEQAPVVDVMAPRPHSSATAQYLRKRRKSNVGGVVLFLFFFLAMAGIAGYFYWNFGLRLEGNLVAARISPEAAKLEQRLQPENAGVSEEVIKAVNHNLLETPRRVQSDLMEMLFYGLEKGGLEVRLKPGAKTELVRVDLTGDPALMEYISKQGTQLDQPRSAELQSSLNHFYTSWNEFIGTQGVMPDLLHYRNSVGLNSLLGGLGYHMEARVNNKIYPCVHEDSKGGLYFLVPKGTLQFNILGREMDTGWTTFPGKYEVQVTQEYPSRP
ncbi:hypothetical protein [Gimesia algae]|uniref:Uncharacterized protein n=1 Tax=Gimesia algae TaxID=2527971 RepID=A0A517VIL7_9PLAN|nr:hypothetical protein [Gimesia algae]QDT92846.1 hypothetical protein Pan161_45170 [Gimesia algae]